jgi:hypothetical protein
LFAVLLEVVGRESGKEARGEEREKVVDGETRR